MHGIAAAFSSSLPPNPDGSTDREKFGPEHCLPKPDAFLEEYRTFLDLLLIELEPSNQRLLHTKTGGAGL